MIRFSIPGVPQGKGRPRITTVNGKGRGYTPDKTVAYENLVKLCYGGSMLAGALKMTVTAYYPVPASKSRKWRVDALSGTIRPTIKPDADNILKIIGDALNGIAYADDKQLVEASVRKYYAIEPMVEVEIDDA